MRLRLEMGGGALWGVVSGQEGGWCTVSGEGEVWESEREDEDGGSYARLASG